MPPRGGRRGGGGRKVGRASPLLALFVAPGGGGGASSAAVAGSHSSSSDRPEKFESTWVMRIGKAARLAAALLSSLRMTTDHYARADGANLQEADWQTGVQQVGAGVFSRAEQHQEDGVRLARCDSVCVYTLQSLHLIRLRTAFLPARTVRQLTVCGVAPATPRLQI